MTTATWQVQLANAITDPQELLALLELDASHLPGALQAIKQFSLRVPRSFVERMRKGDKHDPLLRQVLPTAEELLQVEGYTVDPLEEQIKNPLPGLLHKYHGRVLLITTGVCGVNCRYCFRQHFAYDDNNPGSAGWKKVVAYIANDASISEVILSGGDPLVATDQTLEKLISQLADIPHVKRLRFHSRMPIVLPARITSTFIELLASTRLRVSLVIHCNHAQEINHEVKAAMQALSRHGVTLLNQSVLLKNINDDVETLVTLSETLFECSVLPYYLFPLDKVHGAAHFDFELAQAQALHQALTHRLPGYLVPKLAIEKPGAMAKMVVR